MLRLCALSSTTVCNGMKEVPREVKGWMRRGNKKRWRTNDCWQHEKTSENFQFSTFQLSQVIRSTHSYLLPLLFVSFHFGEFPTFNTQMLVVNVTHRIEYIIIFPNHNLEYSCSWLSTSFALFGITDHVKGCDALLDIRSPSTIWKRNGFIYSSFRCERNSFPQKMLTTLQWIKTRKPTEEVFGKLIHSISTPFILISLEMVAMCMPLSQALYRAFMVYE